ncbi:TIR domain-containing protein [Actinokineospora sp. PR83]|uniref:Rv0361 family membrane protein n=1 Tax=Actinokineospora sp. PR83 TaxID=2884908 RepID=UPI001F195E88|nr:TIR domain-containing protein [Actinokineospora sp. PR83]MCG8918390.1 TIR domain-containing protein [Actinokineospora sp. PR83]
MHVFVTHARRDLPAITRLRADLESGGHRVWSDGDVLGSRRGWDEVLRHVRDCAAFVFAVSPESVRSPACLAELRYARALRRPVLAVTVHPVPAGGAPDELAGAATVDCSRPSPRTAAALRAAVDALPSAHRLPEEPALPAAPTTTGPTTAKSPPTEPPATRPAAVGSTATASAEPVLTTATITDCEALLDRGALDRRAQAEVLAALRARLADSGERSDAWRLLVRLRHTELEPGVAEGVEQVLAPGWQPDPREHHEARYWDGQAWTTLVWQGGREFTDRGRPPEVPDPPRRPEPPAPTPAGRAVLRPRRAPTPAEPEAPRRRRRLSVLVPAGVLVLAAGVTGGVLLDRGFGPDESMANRTARNFVDAVNTHDRGTVTQYVCSRDRTANAHLYGAFLDTADVTLESVDAAGSDPRFTILAARTAGTASVRLSIPLEVENGEWRVCDIGKALSGR